MEIKPMTDAEAREEIRKMGGYDTYRRLDTDSPSDTEAWLVNHEIESELKERNCDAQTLFRERPELFQKWRRTATKIGKRIKED